MDRLTWQAEPQVLIDGWIRSNWEDRLFTRTKDPQPISRAEIDSVINIMRVNGGISWPLGGRIVDTDPRKLAKVAYLHLQLLCKRSEADMENCRRFAVPRVLEMIEEPGANQDTVGWVSLAFLSDYGKEVQEIVMPCLRRPGESGACMAHSTALGWAKRNPSDEVTAAMIEGLSHLAALSDGPLNEAERDEMLERARSAILTVGAGARARLETAYQHSDGNVSYNLALILSQLDGSSYLARLAECALSADRGYLRRECVRGLARLVATEALAPGQVKHARDVLTRALDDPWPCDSGCSLHYVRDAARDALELVGKKYGQQPA